MPLAELDVRGGTAAARRRCVHDVVLQQREGVQQLQAGGGEQRVVARPRAPASQPRYMKVERRHLPPATKFTRMSPATSTPDSSSSAAHRPDTNSATCANVLRRNPIRHPSNCAGSDHDCWVSAAGCADGAKDSARTSPTGAPLEGSGRDRPVPPRLTRIPPKGRRQTRPPGRARITSQD